jgi:NAD-dependent DNA ligase
MYNTQGKVNISTKLDGSSILCVIPEEGSPIIYTRGNGEYGRDISHFLPYL